MNTAKKIKIKTLPQDYSPSTLPEILKLAKKIKGDMALIYERTNKPFFMETNRLIIRRFTNEDAEAVLALSLDRMNSSMKNFDHQWPTDLEGCKGAAAYFSGNDTSYAVCLKPSMELIGYISYNSVTDNGILDLGHVWHTAYQNNDHDTEALSLMTQYAFEKLGVNGVTAGNPLDCEEQIAPLKAIGMRVVEIREKASFVNDENGNPIEFTGCKMLITKEQWEAGNPESYSPKNKPEILNMVEDARQIEMLVKTISYNGITFEVVERPDVVWVGCLDYASENNTESDSDATLNRYQKYLDVVKQDLVNPDWSASLWVNYGCDDKPHGQMFAQETYSANQDARYEVFTQPGGLWLRVRRSKESSLTLFGNESIDAWDYFINEVLQNAAEENGYRVNTDVHVRIGYDCHAEYNTPPHTCYAYIPVIENPESYSPKNKPVILEMVSEASVENKPEIKAAASTIKAEERNMVRIMELPACKMVTSGPANGEDAFAPGGNLARFHEWFTEYDKQRTDQFYPRNFMWSPPGGGFQWGFAVDEIPADINGLEVIDFPGGLYAVAISVDADGQDHDRVYNGILEWVNNSGCFVLDETDERRSLGNITSPPFVKDIIGYDQMDLYFPIAIKEEPK